MPVMMSETYLTRETGHFRSATRGRARRAGQGGVVKVLAVPPGNRK